MNSLSNKTILVISPQAWGKMFVSKHHYAIELAKRGNKVFFLNPPENIVDSRKNVLIKKSELQENLFLIYHSLSFPYNLKFHFIKLFHALMYLQVRKILKVIGSNIDIIWSFDLGNLYPFYFFPGKCLKIFHPVDEPLNKTAINSAEGADVVFSVTWEILGRYDNYKIPKYFINHGISNDFLAAGKAPESDGKVRVGFSGNLLRNDVDREVFLQIVRDNADILIECWGSFKLKDSNIGGVEDIETINFVKQLQETENVILHGVVPSASLAKELLRMDAFLICYNVKKDQSKGTNYHKVMEYISTGKVIISNNISTYKNEPELIQMIEERDDNKNLPALFKRVIQELDKYNAAPLQELRQRFASLNTYQKQLERIEKFLV